MPVTRKLPLIRHFDDKHDNFIELRIKMANTGE